MSARFVSPPDWIVLQHHGRSQPLLGRQQAAHYRAKLWPSPSRSDALRVAVMVPHALRERVVHDDVAVRKAGGYRIYEACSWEERGERLAGIDPRLAMGRSSLSRRRSRVRLA